MTHRTNHLWWILRVGAAACFIGHGAFGLIGKETWLAYFAVVGIPPETAVTLMPIVGAIDIAVGLSVLFRPTLAALAYMTVWAVWTAALRPLSGEPVAELLERAGNYGVPLAMLLMCEWPRDIRRWIARATPRPVDEERRDRVAGALLATTALLLVGHGLLAAAHKPLLVTHLQSLGAGENAATLAGRFELLLAGAIAAVPVPVVAGLVAGWKLATESLFLTNGAPVWEFIERGGSYAAPLALLALGRVQALPRLHFGHVVSGRRAIASVIVALSLGTAAKPLSAQRAMPAPLPAIPDEELLARLRGGGLALACRHAITDHSHEDRNPVDYNDRASQRNLSGAGEKQARALGEAIRAARIPIGQVFSNRLFRTRETATLAFSRTEPVDSLDGDVLRRMLQRVVPIGENRVFVTRAGILSSALRNAGGNVQEGDCLLIEAREDVPKVLARLSPDDFARLARSTPPANQ